MVTLLFVRHGRTTANTAGVLAGWSPQIGLDETGRRDVRDLAARLREVPLLACLTSPLQRCRETTDLILAGRADVPVSLSDEVGECHYGAWTGRPIAELSREDLWPVVQEQPSAVTFPPSQEYRNESLPAMQARAVAAVRGFAEQVAATDGGGVGLVVSHGDVLKALLADAYGMHLDLFQRIQVNPASLSAVRYTPRRPYVLRVNDSGARLADLVPPAGGAAAAASGDDAVIGGATGTEEPAAPPAAQAPQDATGVRD